MKKNKVFSIGFLVFSLVLVAMIQAVWADEKYGLSFAELGTKYKAVYDDPRPFLKDFHKKIMPPETYAKVTFDLEAMKGTWAEVVGFKAPDVVGKIAPEIKPGTYTYKDKEKYPGFKELMIPGMYNRFMPGGPPFAGNFPEIKVVPTRQYYWALPIAEATKKNMGRTKQDDQGYMIPESYQAGFPFPRPEGKFKAQQIVYNWEKTYYPGESSVQLIRGLGFTRNLKCDKADNVLITELRLQGRVFMEPYGWYDKRAESQRERLGVSIKWFAPRDMFGNAIATLVYLDANKPDLWLIYINVLRRIRRLTSTDTQDPLGGQDVIYDDKSGFFQKLSSTQYPYKFELIAEREYLVPFASLDGSTYLSSKGLEFHNLEMERRPMYVVKLTQTDKSYVYSYRIIYFDKETFQLVHADNFDQKGRLYRTSENLPAFIPEMGMFTHFYTPYFDHLDLHSTMGLLICLVSPSLGREVQDLGALVKGPK